jgi:AcrR family transcriptional regulator
MNDNGAVNFHSQIISLEQQELVTRTFRRLDPDRQQEIIAAVLNEVTEKGPANVNIRDVATRSHASVGSIYQYFTNRDGLMEFVYEFVSLSIKAMFNLSQPFLNQMPLREGLKMYVTEGIRLSRAQISIMRFAGQAAYQGDPELRDKLVKPMATEFRLTIERMLEAARKRNEIRAGVDIKATARAINGLLIVLIDSQILPYLNHYFQVSDDGMPFERVLDSTVEMILMGIGNPVSDKPV